MFSFPPSKHTVPLDKELTIAVWIISTSSIKSLIGVFKFIIFIGLKFYSGGRN